MQFFYWSMPESEYAELMHDLQALLTPFADLAKAGEREKALIGPLALALLDAQEVMLPKVSGRKSARLLAAERTVLQQAEESAQHFRRREALRPVMQLPVEHHLPCWQHPPQLGETFTSESGEVLECIDVLFENTSEQDDNYAPHVLLVLPSSHSMDHDTDENNDLSQTLD